MQGVPARNRHHKRKEKLGGPELALKANLEDIEWDINVQGTGITDSHATHTI